MYRDARQIVTRVEKASFRDRVDRTVQLPELSSEE